MNRETVKVSNRRNELAAKNAKFCLKGGSLTQESSMWIKELLATNLLDSCFKLFKEEAARHGANIKTELSVKFAGSEQRHLKNVNREHKTLFKLPSNRNYYIGLTVHAFSKNICVLGGVVNECYIPQTKNFESLFMRSQAQDQLIHVNKDDEEHPEKFLVSGPECQQGLSGTSIFEEDEKLED